MIGEKWEECCSLLLAVVDDNVNDGGDWMLFVQAFARNVSLSRAAPLGV